MEVIVKSATKKPSNLYVENLFEKEKEKTTLVLDMIMIATIRMTQKVERVDIIAERNQ